MIATTGSTRESPSHFGVWMCLVVPISFPVTLVYTESLHRCYPYCGLSKSAKCKDLPQHKLQNGGAQREYCTMIATKGTKRQNASHFGVCYFVNGFFEVIFYLFSSLCPWAAKSASLRRLLSPQHHNVESPNRTKSSKANTQTMVDLHRFAIFCYWFIEGFCGVPSCFHSYVLLSH